MIIPMKGFIFRNGTLRSSHQRCSVWKGVLRNYAKFTGKYLCQNLFINKVTGLRPATLLKKRLWHRCFPVNFVKFLRTPFLQNTCGRQLLQEDLLKLSIHSKYNWLQKSDRSLVKPNGFGQDLTSSNKLQISVQLQKFK